MVSVKNRPPALALCLGFALTGCSQPIPSPYPTPNEEKLAFRGGYAANGIDAGFNHGLGDLGFIASGDSVEEGDAW